ncbi:MAG TPA: hypothetical protein VM487_02070 [Phycisphaerae bacterium]|nr:hypothetical protein [Phycisphaerae bacterium]
MPRQSHVAVAADSHALEVNKGQGELRRPLVVEAVKAAVLQGLKPLKRVGRCQGTVGRQFVDQPHVKELADWKP